MVYRTSQEEINKYFEHPAINQSLLKKLISNHPNTVFQEKKSIRYYEEEEHFIIGSLVDAMMCSTQEEFNAIYYKSDVEKKPTGAVLSIIQWAFDNFDYEKKQWNESQDNIPLPDDTPVEDLVNTPFWQYLLYCSCNYNEYYQTTRFKPNWQEDTRWTSVMKDTDIVPYLETLFKSKGKQIISKDEYNIADGIAMSFRSNPRVAHYFDTNNSNLDFYLQLPIYFTVKVQIDAETEEEFECKALLD